MFMPPEHICAAKRPIGETKENIRKQKKTIFTFPRKVEQKKTFTQKMKMFFICFCLFLSVFSSSAPLERFPSIT
jgi:hypothetical protein